MAVIGVLQIAINDTESVEERTARVFELIRAQKGKCEFVVLPELWHVGAFNMELGTQEAQSREGELVQSLQKLAKETGLGIHGGSFMESHDDGQSNTAVLISPDGDIASFYRKIHLFGFDEGEAAELTAGDSLALVQGTPFGNIGLATCYDVRFPELFRALTSRGAETLIISSGWPAARITQWDILIPARAVENQAWVIACNEVGVHAGITLGGHSMIVAPSGEIVARAGDGEEVIYADIDVNIARSLRKSFPVLRDRKL